jgi:hypothetical protein
MGFGHASAMKEKKAFFPVEFFISAKSGGKRTKQRAQPTGSFFHLPFEQRGLKQHTTHKEDDDRHGIERAQR